MLKLVFQSIFLSFLRYPLFFFLKNFFYFFFNFSDHSIRFAYLGFHTLLYFEHPVFLALDNVFYHNKDTKKPKQGDQREKNCLVFCMPKPLPRWHTKVSAKSWKFLFCFFFADALPRQTEKFWICLCILLPTYLPEFRRLNWDILTKNLVTFKRWDGVKDAKFNVKGVHWKIWFLGRGVTKNQYIGENCLKRENLDSLQV